MIFFFGILEYEVWKKVIIVRLWLMVIKLNILQEMNCSQMLLDTITIIIWYHGQSLGIESSYVFHVCSLRS